jgi:hypothetical protein
MEERPFPIAVYASKRSLYLVGRLGKLKNDASSPMYAILEVSLGKRNEFCPTLHLHEHPRRNSRSEAADFIKTDSGESGAVCVHDRVYCIFGFVPLVVSYQMICVTRVDVAARIHGHDVFSARCTSMVPVPVPKTYYPIYSNTAPGYGFQSNALNEQLRELDDRYRATLAPVVDDLAGSSNSGSIGGSPGAGWYFSYTYDLTSSLQRQQRPQQQPYQPEEQLQHRFLWNGYASYPLRELTARTRPSADGAQGGCNWFVPFIQGFVSQKNSLVPIPEKPQTPGPKSESPRKESSMVISCTLIARRSCNFSGARYLRRGIDSRGNCANEVETEQIISVCSPAACDSSAAAAASQKSTLRRFTTSSLVLLRASVPLYWHNVSLLSLQPGIEVEAGARGHAEHLPLPGGKGPGGKGDFDKCSPAREHFEDLRNRYCVSTSTSCSSSSSSSCPEEREQEYERRRLHSGAIHILNLIKLKESKREQALGCAFREVLRSLVPGVEFSRVENALDKSLLRVDDDKGPLAAADKKLAAVSIEDAEESIFTDISSLDTSPAGSDSDTDYEGDCAELPSAGKCATDAGSSSGIMAFDDAGPIDNDAHHWLTYQAFDLLSYHEGHVASRGSDKVAVDTRGTRKKKGGTVLCPLINRAILHGKAGYKAEAGSSPPPLFDVLDEYARSCLPHTRHFVVSVDVEGEGEGAGGAGAKSSTRVHQLQRGVFRANCVDCLDRTNIAQFCYAKEALALQCAAVGVELSPADRANFNLALMELWAAHGNSLAMQYGGSEAMHMLTVNNAPSGGLYSSGAACDKVPPQEFALVGGLKNVLVAASRYVANASSDYAKQRGIDLLHGEFVPVQNPQDGRPTLELWDLDIHPECCREGYAVEGLVFNYETIRYRMRDTDKDTDTYTDAAKKRDAFEHERHQIGRVTFGDAFSSRDDSLGIQEAGDSQNGGGSTLDGSAEDWGGVLSKALGKGYLW